MSRLLIASLTLMVLLPGCGKDEAPFTSGASTDADLDGWSSGEDCDDNDPDVNPGANECYDDGIDNDCNAETPDASGDAEAPVIVSFEMADGGLHDFGDGEVPSLKATLSITDDVDHAELSGDLWLDSSVDGDVDTSGEGVGLSLSISDETCLNGDLDATLSFYLSVGGSLAYETTYEFGFVVYDDAGNASEIAVTSATTPAE